MLDVKEAPLKLGDPITILLMRYVFDNATLSFVAPVLANIKERNSSTVILAFVKPEEDKSSIYS